MISSNSAVLNTVRRVASRPISRVIRVGVVMGAERAEREALVLRGGAVSSMSAVMASCAFRFLFAIVVEEGCLLLS